MISFCNKCLEELVGNYKPSNSLTITPVISSSETPTLNPDLEDLVIDNRSWFYGNLTFSFTAPAFASVEVVLLDGTLTKFNLHRNRPVIHNLAFRCIKSVSVGGYFYFQGKKLDLDGRS